MAGMVPVHFVRVSIQADMRTVIGVLQGCLLLPIVGPWLPVIGPVATSTDKRVVL